MEVTLSDMAALIATKDIINTTECSLFTGYAVGTIYNLVSRHEIPHFKRGRKTFFKKSEIEAWMTCNRVETNEEIEAKAEKHIGFTPTARK